LALARAFWPIAADGRCRFDPLTPQLLATASPPHRADVVWLLMDGADAEK
jgi:hypothetical protein